MTSILTPLAALAAQKRQVLDILGMQNTYNRTPEERVQMDVEYRAAEEEWRNAEYAYQRALDLGMQ